ncbi:MAG: NfeD family protein [Fimbriimonadaceae bacterium]|nr:NfeD family protein [Chitinophagales bacterium]
MSNWWSTLDPFMQVIWAITLIVSVIFLIQMVMSFLGMDSDTGVTADFDSNLNTDIGTTDHVAGHDHAPFQLFTFRNFINFFLGLGWTVIALEPAIENRFVLVSLGILVGCFMVAMVFYIFYYMSKLTSTGTLNIQNALNTTGTVYIPIPANRGGVGKIQVNVQGSLREMDAMTTGDKIATGSIVKVVEIINNTILLVEKL